MLEEKEKIAKDQQPTVAAVVEVALQFYINTPTLLQMPHPLLT